MMEMYASRMALFAFAARELSFVFLPPREETLSALSRFVYVFLSILQVMLTPILTLAIHTLTLQTIFVRFV
jgi:hypothetical protein